VEFLPDLDKLLPPACCARPLFGKEPLGDLKTKNSPQKLKFVDNPPAAS
jgi:hypothetical protein